MKRDFRSLTRGRVWFAGLFGTVVLAGSGCESVRQSFTPLKESDAVARYEQDPRLQHADMNPWERQRQEQDARWHQEAAQAR